MNGAVIRKLREQQGWSLKELAERSGVSRGQIHEIEHNRNSPILSTLQKLADALGVPVTKFFEGEQ